MTSSRGSYTSQWCSIADMQQAATLAKGREDELAMKQAQKRRTQLLKEQAAKAKEKGAEWERRSTMAANKRSEGEQKNEGQHFLKQLALAEKQRAEAEHRDEMRQSKFLAHAAHVANVQAHKAAMDERRIQTIRDMRNRTDTANIE